MAWINDLCLLAQEVSALEEPHKLAPVGFWTASRVALANRMAHMCRHFEQAFDENRSATKHTPSEEQHLYKIEHIRDKAGLSPDEHQAKSNKLTPLVMETMKMWKETESVKNSGALQTGKATTHAYTRRTT